MLKDDTADPDAPELESKTVTLTFKVLVGKGQDAYILEHLTQLTFRNPCHSPEFVKLYPKYLPNSVEHIIGQEEYEIMCCYDWDFSVL